MKGQEASTTSWHPSRRLRHVVAVSLYNLEDPGATADALAAAARQLEAEGVGSCSGPAYHYELHTWDTPSASWTPFYRSEQVPYNCSLDWDRVTLDPLSPSVLSGVQHQLTAGPLRLRVCASREHHLRQRHDHHQQQQQRSSSSSSGRNGQHHPGAAAAAAGTPKAPAGCAGAAAPGEHHAAADSAGAPAAPVEAAGPRDRGTGSASGSPPVGGVDGQLPCASDYAAQCAPHLRRPDRPLAEQQAAAANGLPARSCSGSSSGSASGPAGLSTRGSGGLGDEQDREAAAAADRCTAGADAAAQAHALLSGHADDGRVVVRWGLRGAGSEGPEAAVGPSSGAAEVRRLVAGLFSRLRGPSMGCAGQLVPAVRHTGGAEAGASAPDEAGASAADEAEASAPDEARASAAGEARAEVARRVSALFFKVRGGSCVPPGARPASEVLHGSPAEAGVQGPGGEAHAVVCAPLSAAEGRAAERSEQGGEQGVPRDSVLANGWQHHPGGGSGGSTSGSSRSACAAAGVQGAGALANGSAKAVASEDAGRGASPVAAGAAQAATECAQAKAVDRTHAGAAAVQAAEGPRGEEEAQQAGASLPAGAQGPARTHTEVLLPAAAPLGGAAGPAPACAPAEQRTVLEYVFDMRQLVPLDPRALQRGWHINLPLLLLADRRLYTLAAALPRPAHPRPHPHLPPHPHAHAGVQGPQGAGTGSVGSGGSKANGGSAGGGGGGGAGAGGLGGSSPRHVLDEGERVAEDKRALLRWLLSSGSTVQPLQAADSLDSELDVSLDEQLGAVLGAARAAAAAGPAAAGAAAGGPGKAPSAGGAAAGGLGGAAAYGAAARVGLGVCGAGAGQEGDAEPGRGLEREGSGEGRDDGCDACGELLSAAAATALLDPGPPPGFLPGAMAVLFGQELPPHDAAAGAQRGLSLLRARAQAHSQPALSPHPHPHPHPHAHPHDPSAVHPSPAGPLPGSLSTTLLGSTPAPEEGPRSSCSTSSAATVPSAQGRTGRRVASASALGAEEGGGVGDAESVRGWEEEGGGGTPWGQASGEWGTEGLSGAATPPLAGGGAYSDTASAAAADAAVPAGAPNGILRAGPSSYDHLPSAAAAAAVRGPASEPFAPAPRPPLSGPLPRSSAPVSPQPSRSATPPLPAPPGRPGPAAGAAGALARAPSLPRGHSAGSLGDLFSGGRSGAAPRATAVGTGAGAAQGAAAAAAAAGKGGAAGAGRHARHLSIGQLGAAAQGGAEGGQGQGQLAARPAGPQGQGGVGRLCDLLEVGASIRRLTEAQERLRQARRAAQAVKGRLEEALQAHAALEQHRERAARARAEAASWSARAHGAGSHLAALRRAALQQRAVLAARAGALEHASRVLHAAEERRLGAEAQLSGPEGRGALRALNAALVARRNRMVATLGRIYQIGPVCEALLEPQPLDRTLESSWAGELLGGSSDEDDQDAGPGLGLGLGWSRPRGHPQPPAGAAAASSSSSSALPRPPYAAVPQPGQQVAVAGRHPAGPAQCAPSHAPGQHPQPPPRHPQAQRPQVQPVQQGGVAQQAAGRAGGGAGQHPLCRPMRLAVGGLELPPDLIQRSLESASGWSPLDLGRAYDGDQRTAASLGYLAAVVDLAASYLGVPLRYPVAPRMSVSYISDPVPPSAAARSGAAVAAPMPHGPFAYGGAGGAGGAGACGGGGGGGSGSGGGGAGGQVSAAAVAVGPGGEWRLMNVAVGLFGGGGSGGGGPAAPLRHAQQQQGWDPGPTAVGTLPGPPGIGGSGRLVIFSSLLNARLDPRVAATAPWPPPEDAHPPGTNPAAGLPLFCGEGARDRTRFAYGLYLINKDIEQLLAAHGLVPVAHNAPLPNLYALVTAAVSGLPHAAAAAAWRRAQAQAAAQAQAQAAQAQAQAAAQAQAQAAQAQAAQAQAAQAQAAQAQAQAAQQGRQQEAGRPPQG